ncbi:AAA family ATPase [bacterium]|nr:MAG: AAA family ATPase [bacterium]
MSSKIPKPNIGSEWRKWDLHVHSPASDGFSGTWDQFETQLKNADCDVIGINDYFSVAGYKQIKEKIDKGDLDVGGKKILPVVEFRMTESVQNKNTTTNGATHFNFHIIFDDQIQIADIENLIKGLKSNGTKISGDYDDKAKLKDKKISLGSLLTELNQDEKFKDKFLLWLPYDEYGGIDEIDPNSDEWIKSNYIRTADVLGSSRQKQIDFFLWKSDLKTDGTVKFTQDQFRGWFLRKKACIKGSDSHAQDYPIGKLKDKDSKPIEKYCWIKAEPTFEGLKQIVYEPETRIFIGEEKPKKPINTIDTITLKIPTDAKVGEDKFCFAGNNGSYNLSPYFNCFIGGRGSGKSTILNFLGLHSNNPDSPKKFWNNLSPSFDPNDNNIFSFGGTEIFEFLAQSEIETFARDKSKFTQAIYDRANSHAGNILEEYEEEIESLKGKLGQIIQAVSDLKTLEDQKIAKEKEKRTLESSVKVLSSKEYNEVITGITDKSKELQELEDWKENISDLKNSLSDLIPESESEESKEEVEKTEYEKAYDLAVAKIAEAVELLKEEKFAEEAKKESEIKKALTELEAKAKTLIEKAGYTPESVEQIKSAPQKITNLESEIKSLTAQIEAKTKVLATLENVVAGLSTNKQNYETKITEILKPLQDLLKKQFEDNQGKDIKQISLEYSFNEKGAWVALAEEFYNYFFTKYHDTERGKEVCEFITGNEQTFSKNSFDDVRKIIQQSQKSDKKYTKFLDEVFKEEKNFQIFQAIRDKHLYDVKLNKIIQVKYDNRDVEQASFGQRCTAVVVILLLFGNYPLIIDEPEAHLDSSLIANYLVPLLKEKKSDRQIIFATHNANFVINGDAEKIFILKNESGQTEVIETTIEDTKNREELLKLEGGKEAFEKRGEKLNIK